MKKYIILCWLTILPLMARGAADAAIINGLVFDCFGNWGQGTCRLTGNFFNNPGASSYSGVIDIPSTVTYNGITYNVTTLGANAFYGSSVTSVRIPASICFQMDCFGYGSNATPTLKTIVSYVVNPTYRDSPTINESRIGLENLPSDCAIIVPTGALANYNGWSKYFKGIIVENAYFKADDKTMIYGSVPSLTYTYATMEPLIGTPHLYAPASQTADVGEYWIDFDNKYAILGSGTATFVPGKLTITKAPLTVKAKSYTIAQGDPLPTFEVIYSGFRNGQTSSVLSKKPTITCSATSSSAPGTYDIIVSGADALNYEMTYVKGTLTITGSQTINLTTLPTMTYGDAAYTLPSQTDQGQPLTWSVSNTSVAAVSGNTLTINNVGTTKVTATAQGNSQYNAFSKEYTLTVNKAPLTITAQSYTIKQGDPMPTFKAMYSGFKKNETSSVLTVLPTFNCTATSASAPGTYDIIVSGAEAQNYEMTYVKGTLTITEADPVTVTAKNYIIKYGEALPNFEYTTEGVTLVGIPALSCEASSTSPVGTYPITVTKGSVENYNVTYVAGTLTIEKTPLTITAKDATMVYGGNQPTFEVTYNGFVNNEDVSVLTKQPAISTEATSSSPSGTYAIIASGAEAQNYAISYVNGTLTIGKRTQTIAMDDNLVMTYGDGIFTLPEETEQGLLIDWSSDNTTVAAVVGNTLMVKGAGTATLTAEQEGDNNNQQLTKDITLTVNKAPLTVTAKSYTIEQGQSLPTFGATYEGFVNNQSANVLTKQPTFTCEAANSDVPGTYAITASGAEAKNYEMSYVAGTLTITSQPSATVTAHNYTIQYGDELPEFDFTSEGAELTGTPLLSCEATSASPVGTYPITVTKGSVENYNVTYVAGTLTIEKAPLTITAQSYSMVQGEEFPEFEALYNGFKNGETESALKRKPQLATLADEYSGPGEYEIFVSSARSDNYDITYVNGTLTIEANSGIATYIAKIPDSSVVMKSKNGEITVEGLADGQKVSIHTYGGMLIGTATTVDGKATINTSLTPGSIVIVRVANKTVKYVVR